MKPLISWHKRLLLRYFEILSSLESLHPLVAQVDVLALSDPHSVKSWMIGKLWLCNFLTWISRLNCFLILVEHELPVAFRMWNIFTVWSRPHQLWFLFIFLDEIYRLSQVNYWQLWLCVLVSIALMSYSPLLRDGGLNFLAVVLFELEKVNFSLLWNDVRLFHICFWINELIRI